MSKFDTFIILIAFVIHVVVAIIVDLTLVYPEKSEPPAIPLPPSPPTRLLTPPSLPYVRTIVPKKFQAPGWVMDIITNSLDLNHDIFLRKLVSNAANACNKERFLSISSTNTRLSMKIRSNRDRRAVTIKDLGVGVTRLELMNNLSRIVQWGMRKFVEALGEKGGTGNVNLIGSLG